MVTRQNPTDQQSLTQWELYRAGPRERRKNVISALVTIYGEAPSGAHESEPRWIIWKETKDAQGRTTILHAQDGINNLIWIYNTTAFDPVPNPDGTPYHIALDNDCVFDGMVAGLPVANITVFDVDDVTHTLTVVYDPENHFTIVGNVLILTAPVLLAEIAYPLRIRAVDDEGKTYEQTFAIYVKPFPPPPLPTGAQEHINGTVALAGTPDLLAASTGLILSLLIQNPAVGPNANAITQILLISHDGGATYFSIPRGGFYALSGAYLDDFLLDATQDNTNYEIILEHD